MKSEEEIKMLCVMGACDTEADLYYIKSIDKNSVYDKILYEAKRLIDNGRRTESLRWHVAHQVI